MTYFALVAIFALGAAAGWTFIPWLSDALLRRSYARELAWWWNGCEAYRIFRERCPDVVPVASSPGIEGALGVWLREAVREAAAGTLTAERARDLVDVGMPVEGKGAFCSEEERRTRFRFRPKIWHRAVLTALGATGAIGACLLVFQANEPFAGEEMLPLSHSVAGLCIFLSFALCFVAMTAATVCDLRARVIPIEACVAIAVSGVAFQAMTGGLEGIGSGVLFAVGVVAVCSLVNRLFRIRSPADAVGGGDIRCMAALSLASGAGAFCGMVACYACASVFSVLGCLFRRLKIRDGVPMAPFLAVWLACGAATSMARSLT